MQPEGGGSPSMGHCELREPRGPSAGPFSNSRQYQPAQEPSTEEAEGCEEGGDARPRDGGDLRNSDGAGRVNGGREGWSGAGLWRLGRTPPW